MGKTVLRFSIFESNPGGHGGEKRTAQITEILEKSGISSEIIPKGLAPLDYSRVFWANFFALSFYFFQVMKITGFWFSPRKLFKTIRFGSQFKGVRNSNRNKKPNILIWESTRIEYSFIVPMFRKRGFKIVATPHNIESLVPGLNSGITDKSSPDWFMEEIKMLRKCDHVFAISREEVLILRQFKVKAKYLPYYPTNNTLNYLLSIRDNRGKKKYDPAEKKKILMLGSAINTPTKEGMVDRINFFQRVDVKSYEVVIAGYGTNQLESTLNKKDNVKFLGELAEAQLSDLLITTDILLVHQTATSGALTRIVEMLIAGIPVIANFESGRNYYGTNGLYIYNNDQQLIKYLEISNYPVPEIPEKPTFEIEVFQQTILNIT
jgi:glycosyltransferase involved in cell wall biosynthesis